MRVMERIQFFNFGVGAHRGCGLLKHIGSTASGLSWQL